MVSPLYRVPLYTMAQVIEQVRLGSLGIPQTAWHLGGCLADASKKAINPFITPIVIDAGATPKLVQWKEDVSLTLCEKRASAGLYWCNTKGGYITVDEMSALQGFDGTINYRQAGVTDTAYAGCLGAAQTLTVVEHVLCHALFLAQMITKAEMDTMKSACRS